MANKVRVRVGYDIDDTLMSFNVPFMAWANKEYGIDFSNPIANGFFYNDRHGDLGVDWSQIVEEFTLEYSVELMKPEAGLVDHLEEFKDITDPFIVTSRPKEHRGVSEQLIEKHLSRYFSDLSENLIMPDEIRQGGRRPSKAAICAELDAVVFFEDAVHNYESFLKPGISTKPILFRTETSVWNHQVLPEGVERVIHLPNEIGAVAENWPQASKILRDLLYDK